MEEFYYIGLDLYKKSLSTGLLRQNGEWHRCQPWHCCRDKAALLAWIESLPQPWVAAMEVTMFTGLVYDFLKLTRRNSS